LDTASSMSSIMCSLSTRAGPLCSLISVPS
jgi:hypothetical protein